MDRLQNMSEQMEFIAVRTWWLDVVSQVWLDRHLMNHLFIFYLYVSAFFCQGIIFEYSVHLLIMCLGWDAS